MNVFAQSALGRFVVLATFVLIFASTGVLAFVMGGLRADMVRSVDMLESIKESLLRAELSRQSIMATIVANQRTVISNEELILKRLDAHEK